VLPQSHGYATILVVVDHLAKHTHVIPTTSDVTTSRVVQLSRDHIWKLYGLSELEISDRGTQFMLNLTYSLSQLLGIKVAALTAYYLHTNGQIEQDNQEVKHS